MNCASLCAPRRTRPLCLVAAGALYLSVSACADAPTGPAVSLVASETAAALRIAGEPPTLGWIVSEFSAAAASVEPRSDEDDAAGPRDRRRASLDRALELWRAALATDDAPEARALRERAYRLAAPELASSLGPNRMYAMRARMAEWIAVAERLPLPEELGVAPVLADASDWLGRSREASREGDTVAAITGILHAADLLNSLTPRAVADRLIRRAELARSQRADSLEAPGRGESPALRRADRLLNGARAARVLGKPVRAIQRAYYALRLLNSF